MNEALFFITIIVNFAGVIFAYKFFGKMGVFAWIALATIVANVESMELRKRKRVFIWDFLHY